jgi:TatD DNase family protein
MLTPQIFDTHCHYNLSPLRDDWQSHWQKAQAHGVKKSVIIGTDWDSIGIAQEIAAQDDNLFATGAIHPNEYDDLIRNSVESGKSVQQLQQELEDQDWETHFGLNGTTVTSGKVIAIGETGLDYFHLSQDEELNDEQKGQVAQLQQFALKKHISLAQKFNLPLIIHVRDKGEQAYTDVLQILKKAAYSGKFNLHCISGSLSYIQEAMEMGAYIGVAGNVTYKTADRIREIVQFFPREKILLETDAPFLPPREFRGKPCEPWMISQTATFIEQELQIDLNQIWQNSLNFFSLKN